MSAQTVTATPWEFRARAFVIFIAFGAGFFFGYLLQGLLFHDVTPSFVLIGQAWGTAGIEACAYAAAALVVVAALLRAWASSYHSPGVVMAAQVVTGTFTAAGPYRYVRNPLYLGNVLLSIGIGLLGPPVVTILVVILNLWFVYRLIAIEERFLRASEGQAYEEYCRVVPRLMPRLGPAQLPADPRKPNVMRGVLTEFYMLGFAAAMIYTAYSVTSGRHTNIGATFWVIAGSAVVAQMIISSAVRSRAQ